MATIPELLAQAVEYHGAGQLYRAEQLYRQILGAAPDHADAWHLLGVLAHQSGQHGVAADYIGRAIRFSPRVAAYHSNLGEVYRASRKPDEALASCRRALELEPNFADAHYNLGIVLSEQGRWDEAATCYRQVLALQPEHAAALVNLGNVLKEQEKLEDAVTCYRRALALRPELPEAHNNLGYALQKLGHLDDAIQCYQHALALKPDFVEAITNLGNAWREKGQPEQAVTICRRAVALKPEFAEAHCCLGTALTDLGRFHDAEACYDTALALKPDLADAHGNRAALLLMRGDFEHGWPEYEWRWQSKQLTPRHFNQPIWDGTPLAGRTILLHAEQGVGDTLHFVRYAALCKRQGGTVIVECQGNLLPLLSTCPGVDCLTGQGSTIPPFEVHAPFMSLPGLFKTSLSNVPADVPYLFADPALVEHWQERLHDVPGFKIGIAWHGNPAHGDRHRFMPLACFALLAELPGVSLISLQKGPGAEQLEDIAGSLRMWDLGSDLDEGKGAFMDTAAVMKNLDLVVSADLAIPHLAGALGVPVWLALSFVANFRWLLDRSDSPWYPTMRLFRQKTRGDWQGVFAEIRTALQERLAVHGRSRACP